MKHYIVYFLSVLLCSMAYTYTSNDNLEPVSEKTRQFILEEFAKRNIIFTHALMHRHDNTHYCANHNTIFVPDFLSCIGTLVHELNTQKIYLEHAMNQHPDELYPELESNYNFVIWLLDIIKNGSIDDLLTAKQSLHDAINFYDNQNNEQYKQLCTEYLYLVHDYLNTHTAIFFHEYTHIQKYHTIKLSGIWLASILLANYVYYTYKHYQATYLHSNSCITQTLYTTGNILLSCFIFAAPVWFSAYCFEQDADDHIPDEEKLLENIIKELAAIEKIIKQSYISYLIYIIDPHPSMEKRIARFKERIEKIKSSGYSRALINYY